MRDSHIIKFVEKLYILLKVTICIFFPSLCYNDIQGLFFLAEPAAPVHNLSFFFLHWKKINSELVQPVQLKRTDL